MLSTKNVVSLYVMLSPIATSTVNSSDFGVSAGAIGVSGSSTTGATGVSTAGVSAGVAAGASGAAGVSTTGVSTGAVVSAGFLRACRQNDSKGE